MGNFNRSNRSGGGRGFERRGFTQMHQAVCDNCRQNCEVPFRPTSGKPIFCSSCFENNRAADSRRFEGRSFERSNNFTDKQIFDAVCDECGNSCKVPFQPTSGKPIYCSNCFGDKKMSGSRNREQYREQFEQLNNKIDKILILLAPNAFEKVAFATEDVEEVKEQPLEKQAVKAEKKIKIAKKKPH